MTQEAIFATEDNASEIAKTLIDYSEYDILNEIYPILENLGKRAVLVRQTVGPDYVVSHIVSEPMFFANAKTEPMLPALNDQFFVPVIQL